MVALALVPVQSMALVFALSAALALISAAIPWLARSLRGWPLVLTLVVGFVVGVTAALLSVGRGLPLTPLTDLMALVVAWSGGLLLGRGMPTRFSPFLLLFLCLSVLDVLLAVGGYPQTPPTGGGSSPLVSANFALALPWGRFEINLADLLLLTAVAEHWRRRSAGYLIALLPGVIGLLLADGVILATGLAQPPAFPFFTAGYVASEGVYRSVTHQPAAPRTGRSHRQSPRQETP
jgi:hypothetical protein